MTARSPLRALALTVVIVVIAACAQPVTTVPSTPAPSPSEAATAPTPTPTPAVPTVPPFRPTARPSGAPPSESLRTSASVERDGIKLTIRLGGVNPMHAEFGTVAFVTVENTGDRLLRWSNDGCDTHAGIRAVVDATWRDSTIAVSPELAPYREWFWDEADLDQPIWLRFDKAELLAYRSYGCADLAIGHELAPGRKVTQELIWNGNAAPRLGLPPPGPATLTARFGGWSRPGPGRDGTPLQVTLDSWVLTGRPADFLSPAEAIDAALADERLASWLITRPLRASADAVAEYDRDLGLWAVGLLMFRDDGDPILHAAFLDPITGEVIAIREHRVEY